MASLTLVLFRDDRSASADAVAILRGILRSRAGHYSLTEIDVEDRPEFAVQYHVKTTPTILLVKNGDIVDRIVGTPTTSLVHNLLDTRTLHGSGATPSGSQRTPMPTSLGQKEEGWCSRPDSSRASTRMLSRP